MHQLPAGFFGCILGTGKLIVLGDISVQGAQQNHGHHARQEEHDHQGIQDGEPMDLTPGHLQVVVPPRSPSNVTRRPNNIIGVNNLVVKLQIKECIGGVLLALHLVTILCLSHGCRLHLEAYDIVGVGVRLGMFVVLQVQRHMIVDKIMTILLNSHREALHVRELILVVPSGSWQIVNYHVHQVLIINHSLELLLVIFAQI
mmetsp:Transcript_73152/g.174326  ORF Transcript_73152/g.174326 Transcript_73152/m.174326 type:complete len:201 (-) Transcript_73152:410-1012(-)